MADEDKDLQQLLAIVNNKDDEVVDGHRITEEEIKQALNSPSMDQQMMASDDDDDGDEDSTECDDYEVSAGGGGGGSGRGGNRGDSSGSGHGSNHDNSNHHQHHSYRGSDTSVDQFMIIASDQSAAAAGCGDGGASATAASSSEIAAVRAKPGEYQFQMMDHHIFKGKHGKKLYKCDICGAVYRHSFSLKRHFIRSHINYGYLCETDVTNCGINLAASASLQQWRKQCASRPPKPPPTDLSYHPMPELFCCHSCVLYFDDLPAVKSHVDDCHRNTSSGTIEPIRIPCSQCNMSFIQRHNLVRHVEVVHQGKRLFGCKHCNKKFQTIVDRKRHEKSQHPNQQQRLEGDEEEYNDGHNQVDDEEEEDCQLVTDLSLQNNNNSNRFSTGLPPKTTTKTTTVTVVSKQHTVPQHKCLRCTQLFPTYAELRKHVTKKHKECYHPCGFCHKFLFVKKQLTQHLRQKHQKTSRENTEKLRTKRKGLKSRNKYNNSSQSVANNAPMDLSVIYGSTTVNSQMSQTNQFQAYFHCSVCYRRFLTYGKLIHHKQIAHRPTPVRNCSRLTTETYIDRDLTEPRSNAYEMEFYRTLAQKVAENLLYFVDGKGMAGSSPDLSHKVILNHHFGRHDNSTGAAAANNRDINLSEYNFPEDFLNERSPPVSANTEKLEYLFDCNLNRVENRTKFGPFVVESNDDNDNNNNNDTTNLVSVVDQQQQQQPQQLQSQNKSSFICTACHHKISADVMADHELNNHPNVECTYLEVDAFNDIPAQLLLWQYHCAEGLLHRCRPAPTLAKTGDSMDITDVATVGDGTATTTASGGDDHNATMKCTKCQQSFRTVGQLHNHILECAHNRPSKKRITATQEQQTIISQSSSVSSQQLISANVSATTAITTTSLSSSTTTPSTTTANIITTNNTSITSSSMINTSSSTTTTNDSTLTECSFSSNATEKVTTDYSSPLSPSKTRSGKRRQINSDEVRRPKRRRRLAKNGNNKTTPKIDVEELLVHKNKSNDSNNNNNENNSKCDEKSPKEVVRDITADRTAADVVVVKDDSNSTTKVIETSLPKRYSCKKCTKKFVYKDTLSKHEMSCKRVVKDSDNNTINKKLIATSPAKTLTTTSPAKTATMTSPKSDNEFKRTLRSSQHQSNNNSGDQSSVADSPSKSNNTNKTGGKIADELNTTTSQQPLSTKHNKSESNNKTEDILNEDTEEEDMEYEDTVEQQQHKEVIPIIDESTVSVPPDEESPSRASRQQSKLSSVVATSTTTTTTTITDSAIVSTPSSASSSLSSANQSLHEHQCPDCLRIFTYLANFKKHITNICPIRKQLNDEENDLAINTNSTPLLTSTPISSSAASSSTAATTTKLVNESISLSADETIKQEKSQESGGDSKENNSSSKTIEDDDNDTRKSTEIIINNDITTNDDNNNNKSVVTGGSGGGDDAAEDEEVLIETSSSGGVSSKDEKLDLWRVKQENPQFAFKGSPAQHHSCPYCQRGFTYLANYRKHIKSICPIRQQIDEKKKQIFEDSANGDGSPGGGGTKLKADLPPTLVYTPSSLSVRSQIEDTVLTLLRDQTKQDQILQTSEEFIKSKASNTTGQQKQQSGGDQSCTNPSDVNLNQTTTDETQSKRVVDSCGDTTTDRDRNDSSPSTTTPAKGSSFRFRTFSCSICHKIFLSYVTMLKHRLSHKLSDGSANCVSEDSNSSGGAVALSGADMSEKSDNELIDKEAANQALAVSILSRSKDVLMSKMRINSQINKDDIGGSGGGGGGTGKNITTGITRSATNSKALINTTELLEKLARGGGISDKLVTKSLSTTAATSATKIVKTPEVITIETNNNDSQAVNLHLRASTSGGNSHLHNNNNNDVINSGITDCVNNNNVEEIIIDSNSLKDFELNVLKDGLIVTQDLQQLITVNNDGQVVAAVDDDPDGTKCPEVLLNLDDIENANEVWITITDSSALIQVPPNHNNNTNNTSASN
ncbi:serine-rich adhesin for platelets-like [Oppia nitens]|uniref:serine-rich adhesin for platelets-like n=1 Tax=Oppia nitens TaxID=1686743 RepID=UPI0023DC96A3|nr:serine-rich adhesin for platelets-like [Oppia nitens]